MTYFDAVSIQQDFIVNMQYADIGGKEKIEALKEVAEKYTDEQLGEAYKAISAKMKEEREKLKNLFILAIKSRGINIPVETNKNGKV
jgi:hypothetical protein